MTSLFKLIGSGDTMTGMTRAVYAFTAIIGIIILVCAIFMIRNYLNARRKSGVQLKSKTAEKKKERRIHGPLVLLGKHSPYHIDLKSEESGENAVDYPERRRSDEVLFVAAEEIPENIDYNYEKIYNS